MKKISLAGQDLTWEDVESMIPSFLSVEYLDLSKNRIASISESILVLKQLRNLVLSNNQLTEIPLVLFSLPKLRILTLSDNLLESIPQEFESSQIDHLFVKNNRIQDLDFGRLRNLEQLNISNNLIHNVSVDCLLPRLKSLSIGKNPVRSLNLDKSNLPSLKYLNLYTPPGKYLTKVADKYAEYFKNPGNSIEIIGQLTSDPFTRIDIDLLNEPYNLTERQLIHRTKFNQILSIIKEFQRKGIGYSEEKEFKRSHNIITLSGSRGTGKTTLLRSINIELNGNKQFNNVKTLEIIDPTLIEEKGHIFLNIISLIRKKVVNETIDKALEQTRKDWDNTLISLAGGLPQLDGIQGGLDPSDWNDPQYVMFTGLKTVQSAIDLEKNFHKFVRLSLKILKKDYFVLLFDDVDNDFVKGWPVLETLRKYLTSPQLIILISGDLDLFSCLVRKKQWKNFGKPLLKNEFDPRLERELEQEREHEEHDYPRIVEELESQYLIKLLSPRYRVTLDSLLAKLSRGEIINITSKRDDNTSVSQTRDVRSFYQYYLGKLWGVNSSVSQHDYSNLLLSLPIRTQVELMSVLQQEPTSSASASRNAAKALTDLFYSELKSYDVDVWELVNEFGEINIFILRFLLKTKLLDEASQLYPKLNNRRLDASVTALGLMLEDRFTRRPYEIFDYIIRISYLVSKSNWPSGIYDGDHKEVGSRTILGLVEHSFLKYDYGMRKIASLQSAYTMSFPTEKPSSEGLIPIYGLNRYAKEKNDDSRGRLDQVFKERDVSYTLAMIPVFAIQGAKHERVTYFSFYNLLATVGELLLCDPSQLKKEFHKLNTFRVYPSYYDHTVTKDQDQVIVEDEMDDIIDESVNDVLVKDSLRWKKDIESSKIKIPPYVIGRAMVRTQRSFIRIDTTGKSVGQLIHRMLAIFLNAVLVEEQNERGALTGMRLSNPVGSDFIFKSNIYAVFGEMAESDKRTYLSYHLLNCPLILAYMDMDPDVINKVSLSEFSYNIYNKLNELKVIRSGK